MKPSQDQKNFLYKAEDALKETGEIFSQQNRKQTKDWIYSEVLKTVYC